MRELDRRRALILGQPPGLGARQQVGQPRGAAEIHGPGMVADGAHRGPESLRGGLVRCVALGRHPYRHSCHPNNRAMSAASVIGSNGFGITPANPSLDHASS